MLEIRPIPDPHEAEAIAARCGITYDPHCLSYAAFAEHTPVTLCQFRYNSDGCAYIHALGRTETAKEHCENTERFTLIGVLAFCTQNGCDRFIFLKNIPAFLPGEIGLRTDPNGTARFG